MRRGPKPAKSKEAKPPARKSPKDADSRVRDLEKQLAAAQEQLQTRDRELVEALEQQTATAEILRVISSSPTDVQPVFEAVLASGVRLCGAQFGGVFRFDGELIHLVTSYEWPQEYLEALRRHFPMAPGDGSLVARAIRDRRVVQTPDYVAEARAAAGTLPPWVSLGDTSPRSTIAIPMMREGSPLGGIVLARAEPGLFSDQHVALLQTFAAQAVIAIENVRLFNETKEALDQQTATSEILRVISASPTDIGPVLDTVARTAARLCDAVDATIHRLEGNDRLRVAAHYGPIPLVQAVLDEGWRLDVGSVTGRAILEGRRIHVEDLASADEFPVGREYAQRLGHRTTLAVPLLRQGAAIGAIVVRREQIRPFTEIQIELLETFADQAVIAIENVRLFTELEARNQDLTTALDQQTATSEILKVISSSPTNVQPVFDAIVRNAANVCGAFDATLALAEGDDFVIPAHHGPIPRPAVGKISIRGTVTGQAIRGARTVHVEDLLATEDFPVGRGLAREIGYRTVLCVPLLREGAAIGAIGIRRNEVRPFADKQIALLQTFADQAVIAIENVRLFTELQASNRELTTALDTQTATSDILRVISRSQTDVQPVFDAIVASAARLLRGFSGGLTRVVGDQIELAAFTSTDDTSDAAVRATFPRSIHSEDPHAQLIRARAPVNIADAQTDPRVPEAVRANARARGYRSQVVVPLLRHDEAVGTIGVTREEPGGFNDDEIALLKTFADQAVIAIENARLLTELQTRTQELTRSVGQLTALGEVGRAVSSTLDLETVLSTIVSRAIQLSGTDGGSVYEYDEATEEFSLRASRDLPEAYVEQVRDTRPRKGEGAVGRVAQTREPVQIADISDPAAYESRVRHTLLHIGLRALLAVPLIAEDQLVGALIVMRKRAGTFAAEEVTLLQTFATQSALAIQNARLFREIADKSRQLEAASQHKSEFLANMSHELRTPLNAIIGFSEVLTERMFGELNEKQDEYLKDIFASGQHLLSLINDILDLSKIEAGRMELELSDFHLPTALDSALTLVRERAGRRSIALQMNVDERLGEVRADERKIRQVVLNLLSNAIKFTPEGGRIEVAAMPKDGFVEVSVRDTGVGIAPEDQEAVFEEFRQVGTADKKVEGTGLGLTLCRKFVELHGGRIWVKSELGAGSTFTFTLPVLRGE